MTPAPHLERIQRWMQTVVTHPDGISSGMAASEAQALIAVKPGDLESVITRSHNLAAAERLEVYHNAYFARLLACLREEFPILMQTITEEVFDAFASDYLQRYPSRSYTLSDLGKQFSRYLAETRMEEIDPADELGWEQFVIDLATLEWTYSEVFDGPGVEKDPPYEPPTLSSEEWLASKLTPVPCLRLLALRFPVHLFYKSARKDPETSPPGPSETFLAITRRDYVVRHVELSAAEHSLLSELVAGSSVGDAIAALSERDDIDNLEGQLAGWFRKWAAEGFFR
jgi:hypothetical protein